MIKKIAAIRTQGTSLQDAAGIMVKDRVLSKKIHENLSRVLEILDEIRDLAPARAMEVYNFFREESDTDMAAAFS